MKMVHNIVLPILVCAVFVGIAVAAPAPPSSADSHDTINGIAIVAGVERLSYISDRYYAVRPDYDACVRQSQGRVVDQGDCADTEFKYQDARLNRAYKNLTTRLADSDKKAAMEAQLAWLAFFAKDCSSRAGRFGSDGAPSNESICRMKSTAIRAQQLEDWSNSVALRKSP